MSEIKPIIDENGNQICPPTWTKAVYDETSGKRLDRIIGDTTKLPNPDAGICENVSELSGKLLAFKNAPLYSGVSLKDALSDMKDGEIRIFTMQNCSGYSAVSAYSWAHCIVIRRNILSSSVFGLMFNITNMQVFTVPMT